MIQWFRQFELSSHLFSADSVCSCCAKNFFFLFRLSCAALKTNQTANESEESTLFWFGVIFLKMHWIWSMLRFMFIYHPSVLSSLFPIRVVYLTKNCILSEFSDNLHPPGSRCLFPKGFVDWSGDSYTFLFISRLLLFFLQVVVDGQDSILKNGQRV